MSATHTPGVLTRACPRSDPAVPGPRTAIVALCSIAASARARDLDSPAAASSADATHHTPHLRRFFAVLAVDLVLELLREILLDHPDLRTRACAQARHQATSRQRLPCTQRSRLPGCQLPSHAAPLPAASPPLPLAPPAMRFSNPPIPAACPKSELPGALTKYQTASRISVAFARTTW